MILKALRTLRTIASHIRIPSLYSPIPLPFRVPHQTSPFCTFQTPQQSQQREPRPKKKKIFSSSPSQQQSSSSSSVELTGLIRLYRTRMQNTQRKTIELCYHCKKIADYYKKANHSEFVQQKSQLMDILDTMHSTNWQGLDLKQYLNLLDFVRICSNVESINYSLSFRQAKEKVFLLYEQFKKKIQVAGLVQLSILYCKLAPIYHPQTFTVSGLLHDRIAQDIAENKKLDLSSKQIYVILRSMGKRDFLSFPDKKILQMLLTELKERKITDLTLPLAVALKDLNVQVNLGDYRFYSISDNIQAKALAMTQEGLLQSSNIEYLQTINKSDNNYFTQIFIHLTKQYLSSFPNQPIPSLAKLKEFVAFVKQLPSQYLFQGQEKRIVIQYCQKLYEKQGSEQGRKRLDYEVLQLVRSNFFAEDLNMLDTLFHEKGITFVWSFPLEYSLKGVKFTKFPPSILQQPLTKLPRFHLDINKLKLWVSLQIQSSLHPQNPILKQSLSSSVQLLKSHKWEMQDLSVLIKLSVLYPELVLEFHKKFSWTYLEGLAPTKEEIANQRSNKRGEKSKILPFWEYLLLQQHCPLHLISKIPPYALYISCYRQSKIKNQQPHLKGTLLLSLSHKLSSKKIKLTDNETTRILQLLILYSRNLNSSNQVILQLYWNCVMHIVRQYSSIKQTLIPTLHFLFSKLLNLTNPKIKHSLFYKNYLSELIRLLQTSTISTKYSYFRTSIIRQGILHNSISDIHLSHIDIAHFDQQQQDVIFTLYNKYQPKEEINSMELLLALRAGKGHRRLMESYQTVCKVVEMGGARELGNYLIHCEYSKESEQIVKKICSQFVAILNASVAGKSEVSVDFMSILKNINEIYSKNTPLYTEVMLSICNYLTAYPSTLFLIDHSQILDLLQEYNIPYEKYSQSLWDHCRQTKYKSSAIIDIMLKLHSKQANPLTFFNEDYEYAYKNFIKLIVQQQSQIDNVGDKVRSLIENIQRPLPSSLTLTYLQQKYNILIAKKKPSEQRTNFTIQKFIKLIEQNGIKLKPQTQTGQPIYRINQKTILSFIQRQSPNEFIMREKLVNFLFPQHQIVEVPSFGSAKDISYALSQLNILEKEIFTLEIVQKIEGELQNV